MVWPLMGGSSGTSSSTAASIRARLRGGNKRDEDQVCEDIRHWTTVILPGWPSGKSPPVSTMARKSLDCWWRGVPACIRERVWRQAIGNDLNLTSELYEICLSRSKEKVWTQINPLMALASIDVHRKAKPCHSRNQSKSSIDVQSGASSGFGGSSQTIPGTSSSSASAGDGDTGSNDSGTNSDDGGDPNSAATSTSPGSPEETVADLIRIDVQRTFPQLGLFQDHGPYHEPLKNVLGAYVTYRPDVNYVQGMAFLAGMLLLNLPTSDAFVAFANLLNNQLLLSFYRMDRHRMAAYYNTYQVLFRENLPKLYEHFVDENMSPDLYLVDWFYTMFSRSLPLDVAARVWDLYLRDGEQFLIRASIGLLKMYEDILAKLDFIHLALFLTKLPDSIESERLFDCIKGIRLTSGREKRSFEDILAAQVTAALTSPPQPNCGSNGSIASTHNR